nr:hypothetical protein [Tanacetum cinerariifolium]
MNCFEKSLNEMKNSIVIPTAPLKAVTEIAAVLEDKLDIRMNCFEKSLNEMKNSIVIPTAPLKAVMGVYVTCRSNHSYNQCPLTRGGNDYPVFHDNIQQFQTAAVVQAEVQVDKPTDEPVVVFLPVDNEGHRFLVTFDLKYREVTLFDQKKKEKAEKNDT